MAKRWNPQTIDWINVIKKINDDQTDTLKRAEWIGHDDDVMRWIELNLPWVTLEQKNGPLQKMLNANGFWIGVPQTDKEKKLAKIVAAIYDGKERGNKCIM